MYLSHKKKRHAIEMVHKFELLYSHMVYKFGNMIINNEENPMAQNK